MALATELLELLGQPCTWAAVFGALLVVYLINFLVQVWKLPRGPAPLPFIGNILQLRGEKRLYIKLTEWCSQYGDPLTLWIGLRPMVVASTKESFREISGPRRNHLAGRMRSNLTDLQTRGFEDVAFNDFTPGWDVLRRVSHVALRKYAQTDRLAEVANGVIDDSLDRLFGNDDKDSATTEVLDLVNGVVDNILAISAYGGFDDETRDDYKLLREASDEFEKQLPSGLPSDILPILGWIFYKKEKRGRDALKQFIAVSDKMFARSASTYDPEATPRHFTDVLLQARDLFIAEDRGSAKYLTMENVRQTVLDIFGAGTGTSRTILSFAMLHLANDPELQIELREEVTSAVGKRICVSEDRSKLPLLQAFVQEVLRLYPAAPLSLPRKALIDVTLNGRPIPKGTGMFINLWAVNRDPEIWGDDANSFNPKRFLSATKDQLSRGATAFGIGARSCIGEKMALADFTYVLARLLQRVRLACPGGPGTANLQPGDSDIFVDPVRQNIVLQKL